MRNALEIIGGMVIAVFLVGGIILFGWMINAGLNAHDQAECLDWQTKAKAMPPYSEKNPGGFYITTNEKAQCDYWHIDTGAVVRDSE